MAKKQVLLIKPVKGLGHEGEAVTVKAGYARNYLFPQDIALPVNRSTQRQLEVLAQRREARLTRELAEAKALAERIGGLALTIAVKTGDDGKPHGAITNMEIHKALVAQEISVERHDIKIGEPIKTLGEHVVEVRVYEGVVAELKVNVVSENPVQEKKEEPKKKARRTSHAEKAETTEEPKAE